jgi:hypothetical protein
MLAKLERQGTMTTLSQQPLSLTTGDGFRGNVAVPAPLPTLLRLGNSCLGVLTSFITYTEARFGRHFVACPNDVILSK